MQHSRSHNCNCNCNGHGLWKFKKEAPNGTHVSTVEFPWRMQDTAGRCLHVYVLGMAHAHTCFDFSARRSLSRHMRSRSCSACAIACQTIEMPWTMIMMKPMQVLHNHRHHHHHHHHHGWHWQSLFVLVLYLAVVTNSMRPCNPTHVTS